MHAFLHLSLNGEKMNPRVHTQTSTSGALAALSSPSSSSSLGMALRMYDEISTSGTVEPNVSPEMLVTTDRRNILVDRATSALVLMGAAAARAPSETTTARTVEAVRMMNSWLIVVVTCGSGCRYCFGLRSSLTMRSIQRLEKMAFCGEF